MLNKKKNTKRLILGTAVAAIVLSLAFAVFGTMGAAAQTADKAQNIISSCLLYASKHNGALNELRDGRLSSEFVVNGSGEQYLEIDLNGRIAAGVYIKWGKHSSEWTLEAIYADGTSTISRHGQHGILQEYVPLPEDTIKFRMITADGESNSLRLVELEVYSPGTLPDSVHIWEPTPTTAEIMYISTHQDDEILFFGGAIPYYSGELELDSVVAYTAYDNTRRLHEALEGLWTCGLSQHPVFFYNPDKYASTFERARQRWDEDQVIADLTGLIAKHRPQVVISQDVDGEYGHGQHILTVYCLQQALKNSADEQYMSDRFPQLEPWTVSKCYLHLYAEGNISMPWDKMKLSSAGGKTAFQVACDAYDCHVSQHIYDYAVGTTKERYDCRSFGLYWTQVGEDVQKNDFFENVNTRYTHVQPPESELTSYLERIGSTGWLYRRVDGEWEVREFLRYCQVDGVTGWYAADQTGCLLEPAVKVLLVKDDYSLELSVYETLTQINDRPPVYNYSDGLAIDRLPVRYCAIGSGEADFYLANRDGTLKEPLTRVEVAHTMFRQEEPAAERPVGPLSDGDIRATDIILVGMCILLMVTAVFLCVSVTSLSRKKKRR